MYNDFTSQVTNMALGGIVCILLRLSILQKKSLSSFRYEGCFLTSGCSCMYKLINYLLVY